MIVAFAAVPAALYLLWSKATGTVADQSKNQSGSVFAIVGRGALEPHLFDCTLETTQGIFSMASIQGIYVALFGRPADPAGLAFFNTATKNGADLTAIGDLSSTAEYKARFKDQNNVQIVTSIYQSLFNRDPEAAGLEFFVAKLNADASAINTIAIDILNGAGGDDKKVVDNKVASADAFTKALDTAVEIASYSGENAITNAQNFLKAVTTTAASSTAVANAVKGLADSNTVGNTLTIAANGLDNIVVGSNTNTNTSDKNDTINAGAADNANNVSADDSWVFAADKVDGGFGKDTFNVAVDASVAVADDGLKSIEVVNVTSKADAAAINVAKAKELTEINNKASSHNLSVTNIKLGTTVGVTGDIGNGKSTTFAFAEATGSSDSAKLAVAGATATGDVVIDGIETVEVNNTGTSSLENLKLGDAKTVNITGDGTLNVISKGGKAETIDASKFEGDLTANVTAENALKTFTGSAKSDKVTVDTVGASNDLTVDGGAGADVLTVAAGAADKALTLTGGAGADKFAFGDIGNIKSAAKADFEKSLVTISDFNKAEDVIDVKALDARTTLDNNQKGQIAGAADLHKAVSLAASFATGGKSAVFTYKGDTYIFGDTSSSGDFNAGDTLIKVTGVSNIADLKDGNFLI